MSNLSGGATTNQFPLMESRDVKTVEIVVVTSDRGLCGSFNANIVKLALTKIKSYEKEGKKVSLVCVGKKGFQLLNKTGKVRKKYTDIMASFQMFNAREIATDLADNFLKGNSDKVEVLYGQFHSVAVQIPSFSALSASSTGERCAGQRSEKKISGDYIYEPSTEEIMDVLQPLYLNVIVYHAMLEVGASEHAARMTAMDNATNACKDIVSQSDTDIQQGSSGCRYQ